MARSLPATVMARPLATSAYAASTPRRGLSPSSVAPRQQRSQPGRRHDGACPRRAMLLANNDPAGDAATTGPVPVERCSSPTTIPPGTPPRRGLSPSSDAPRQQRSQPGRRHDGACPRRAMLLASVLWRGAAPRWDKPDKPSGGGNLPASRDSLHAQLSRVRCEATVREQHDRTGPTSGL